MQPKKMPNKESGNIYSGYTKNTWDLYLGFVPRASWKNGSGSVEPTDLMDGTGPGSTDPRIPDPFGSLDP